MDEAFPIFIPDSERIIKRLSNDVSFIFSIFGEETFGVSLVLIPSQFLLYNQIFLWSDGCSLALLYIETP